MKEIKIAKPKKKKRMKFLYIALAIFGIYAVITVINQQIQINEKSSTYNELKDKIVIEEVKTDEIKKIDESGQAENSEYIEKKAREDFDYAYRDERVFINIAG